MSHYDGWVFVYACARCGSRDELGVGGGRLSCSCEREGPDYDGLTVTKVVDGEAEWSRPMAEVMGVGR